MVEKVAPRFRLVKFEGDALFAIADDPDAGGPRRHRLPARLPRGVRRAAGRRGLPVDLHLRRLRRIDALGLKFVLHHGDYVVQRIVGHEELVGPDVIVVHRLLKNHARDLVGERPYALLSDATLAALDVPADGMLPAMEAYDDMPPVPVHVLPLA